MSEARDTYSFNKTILSLTTHSSELDSPLCLNCPITKHKPISPILILTFLMLLLDTSRDDLGVGVYGECII